MDFSGAKNHFHVHFYRHCLLSLPHPLLFHLWTKSKAFYSSFGRGRKINELTNVKREWTGEEDVL